MEIPMQEISGEKWLILKHISNKFVFRATTIDKKKNPVSDPSGHRMDEAVAEGSVKCKPKIWEVSSFK